MQVKLRIQIGEEECGAREEIQREAAGYAHEGTPPQWEVICNVSIGWEVVTSQGTPS